MSYDIYMEADTGGAELAEVHEVGNMTSNVSGMWHKALGYSLADIHGKTGAQVRADIAAAVANIQNPDTRHEYVAMNPPNGWGTVESAEHYLRSVLEACDLHPKAAFRVSR